jgi:hypothetical protein
MKPEHCALKRTTHTSSLSICNDAQACQSEKNDCFSVRTGYFHLILPFLFSQPKQKFHGEFTTIECREPLLERFLRWSMVVLSNIQGKCACLRAKTVNVSGHLPLAHENNCWTNHQFPIRRYRLARRAQIHLTICICAVDPYIPYPCTGRLPEIGGVRNRHVVIRPSPRSVVIIL